MSAASRLPPATASAIRGLQLDRASAEAVTALRRAGIPSILLKGPCLARWLYDHESERPYVDADLLVPPSRFEAAESVLTGLGFRRIGLESIRGDWPRHAVALQRVHDTVDLHRTLVGVAVDDEVLWRELSTRTEPMAVGGADVAVPAPHVRALIVGLHAAKDAGRAPKTIEDLGRAVRWVPYGTWERAAELAGVLGARGALAAGLRRVEGGRELADRLGLVDPPPFEVAIRQRRVPPLATGVAWLLQPGSWRAKAVLVLRKLLPPPAFVRAWSPLARRGRLGLALAYAWRPVWVVARAGPALVAVLRARRASRRGSP